jgi:hypothetical protein
MSVKTGVFEGRIFFEDTRELIPRKVFGHKGKTLQKMTQ